MCKVLQVSKSGYYKWINKIPSKRSQRNAPLVIDIQRIYRSSRKRYESPRITKELNNEGIKASQPLVAKLMRKENIRSIIRKKYKATIDSKHNYPVVENRLMQNFNVYRKNEVWISYITYVYT